MITWEILWKCHDVFNVMTFTSFFARKFSRLQKPCFHDLHANTSLQSPVACTMMNLRQVVGDPPRSTTMRRSSTTSNDNINSFDHTTFEGMIRNSNQVLDLALSARDKDTINMIRPTKAERAIPPILFEKCEGILLLHVIEAAFLVGASIGTGLLLKHNRQDNTWSAPLATGLTGIGWGFMGGIARKDLVVFVMNKETMETLTGDFSVNLGGQASLTIGERGREVDAALHASNKGVGATVAFSYSRGFMVGVSLEGSVVAPRTACNNMFYGRSLTPHQVLSETQVPESVKDLHAKLKLLAEPKKRIREPIVYQATHQMQACDDRKEYAFVQHSESTANKQVAETQNDTYQDDFVLCQDTQTQTGKGHVPIEKEIMDLVVEIKNKVRQFVSNGIAQTQKNENVVKCQDGQTQTGGNNNVVTKTLFEKKTVNDISSSYIVAQTQTDEQVVLCQVAQTQTGDDDDSLEVNAPAVVEKTVSNDISIEYEVAETQTEDCVVLCQAVQTQTGGDDDDDVVMVEEAPIEKKTSNDISIMYKTAEMQTEEQVILSRIVQTQTGGDSDDVTVGDTIETTTSNDISISQECAATQTEENIDDTVLVSDDEEFVFTDGDTDDEMDFVVMDVEEIEDVQNIDVPGV